MPLIKHYRYHKNYRNQLPVINIPNRYYHKNIVEHYENPRNIGSLDNNKRSVGIGLVGAPACGDVMKLSIDVDDYGVQDDNDDANDNESGGENDNDDDHGCTKKIIKVSRYHYPYKLSKREETLGK